MSGGNVVTQKGYNASDVSVSCIYFHIDLRSGYDKQWGYGRVKIEAKTPSYLSGSDTIYGKYVHNKISGSIGINFLSFGNIEVYLALRLTMKEEILKHSVINMDYIVYLLGVTIVNTIILGLILNQLHKINDSKGNDRK
ncbi:hypothetical protein [Paramaledivibacter caminithermalis]|jgi:hypothetical protein|uniref:Uncharacterized protein n=1 Tax=Paramaledivibacter caminithermalis (strain DSM 15212 / CIP 107654 / DViRD3) TaxID=1121301 RepID=A0A1M6RE91_PARC5|nr:hypothetical protein [Paramaledivibacter caminithermalis]SHK30811.1 hypothetical protein SAMN02745912_02937 [Paramaledivibacter caminithermalis DSM 15212]